MSIIQVTHLEARVALDPTLVALYRQYLGAAFRAHVLSAAEAAYCADAISDWGWTPGTDLSTRWAVSEAVFALMKAAHR